MGHDARTRASAILQQCVRHFPALHFQSPQLLTNCNRIMSRISDVMQL